MNSFRLGMLYSSSVFHLPQGCGTEHLVKRDPERAGYTLAQLDCCHCCSRSEHILPDTPRQLHAYRGEPGTSRHTITIPTKPEQVPQCGHHGNLCCIRQKLLLNYFITILTALACIVGYMGGNALDTELT